MINFQRIEIKRKLLLFFISITVFSVSVKAQENKLQFKFTGFIRADVCYDNRMSVVGNDGLFFLYPMDVNPDANGEDLNAQPSLSLFSITTRPAFEVSGLRVFDADVTGKVEADFAGFGGQYGNSTVLRIRQAYMKMQWEKSSLLIGMDWHPFFGPAIPGQVSLNTGAPFNAFNRSPQLRYSYNINNKFSLTGAAIYQFQYNSIGPEGKSSAYQKYALIPEWVGMINYQTSSFMIGGGANFLTLKPRRSFVWNDKIYKADELFYSYSLTAHLKYTENLFSISAKTTYGLNMAHLSMLGGYGVKKQDAETGKQTYTNFKTSSSWLNVAYGKKYLANLLLGYAKNLGTQDPLIENSALYGEGLNIDNLSRVVTSFSYNVPHFKLGFEYEFSHANFGDNGSFSWETGKMQQTHSVNSSRIVGLIAYLF
jgi:hypothetical protein